ncbi:MAG: DUF3572 domain-containing protein [Parvibaculaceae bacterium]|nr:DUF3572 domain-containing protein [Parvibaculaceae bacterium]
MALPANKDQALVYALQALQYVAGDEELLDRFIALTGLGYEELRERAGEPETLAAVMDFVLFQDETIIAVASALSVRPEDMLGIRNALPGNFEVREI